MGKNIVDLILAVIARALDAVGYDMAAGVEVPNENGREFELYVLSRDGYVSISTIRCLFLKYRYQMTFHVNGEEMVLSNQYNEECKALPWLYKLVPAIS